MKDLCQKWNVKLIFQGACRNRVVECLEIIDVGCNLKQFDGLTGLTLIPSMQILRQIYSTGSWDS